MADNKIYLVVGEMGMGKSTHILKRFLRRTKREIRCYNLISSDFEGYPCVNDFDEFINKGVYLTNTVFIVDEASTAIPEEKPNIRKPFGLKLVTWLLNSRKCNNPIFFIYHSWREVPLWLIMYSAFCIRFNTMDMIDIQIRRFKSFPNIVNSFKNFPVLQKFKFDEFKIR